MTCGAYSTIVRIIASQTIKNNTNYLLTSSGKTDIISNGFADMAQEVERILGKDEVTGSTPVISSKNKSTARAVLLFLRLCP